MIDAVGTRARRVVHTVVGNAIYVYDNNITRVKGRDDNII